MYKELKSFRCTTSVKKNTSDPIFKEIFVVNHLPAEYVLLRLEIYGKKTIGGTRARASERGSNLVGRAAVGSLSSNSLCLLFLSLSRKSHLCLS